MVHNVGISELIELKVNPSPPEKSIPISASVGNHTFVDIVLENQSLIETINYKVQIQGIGLEGDDIVRIDPKESKTYHLKYSPLLPGKEVGNVKFVSQDHGEFNYELQLRGLDAKPILLDLFQCPIGKNAVLYIN